MGRQIDVLWGVVAALDHPEGSTARASVRARRVIIMVGT